MSVFDDANEIQSNPLDQLVGEGKKFSNVADLVKSYAESQQFIERLKTENQGIREELGQRVGAEDLFKQIVERQAEPVTKVDTAAKAQEPVVEPNLKVDLAQQIDEAISRRDQERTAAQNAQAVASKLVEVYGTEDKANEAVVAKAAELGVSVKWLQDIAMQSPKAFFATTGLEGQRQTQPNAPRNEVNVAALSTATQGSNSYGTKEYFDNIRRDNPAQYWSPAIQNAIFKAAQEGTYKV